MEFIDEEMEKYEKQTFFNNITALAKELLDYIQKGKKNYSHFDQMLNIEIGINHLVDAYNERLDRLPDFSKITKKEFRLQQAKTCRQVHKELHTECHVEGDYQALGIKI